MKTALQEIKAKEVRSVHLLEEGDVYNLKSGRKVTVTGFGAVFIDNFPVNWLYAWRIRRALKKVRR